MTKSTPWDENTPKITTKGIDLIKGKYLKKVDISSFKELTLSKAEQLFVNVIEDFKNGTLSSDELADFGFKIFHEVAKKYPDSNLFRATLSASDLIFEIRADRGRIPKCLKDINTFYSNHK